MRRQQLVNVLSENFGDISHYRVAGDWKIYIHLITDSRLAYFPQPLNRHRRHESSVTLKSFDAAQIAEIRDIQQWCAREYGSDDKVRRKAEEYLDRLQSRLEIQRASG
jgi:hypothetical protein